MDLVRIALERTDTAARAVEIITNLLVEPGQGGGCGHENRRFTYHNSFMIADPQEAYVLETAGRHWAVERVEGARAISNGLTIPEFAAAHSDWLKTRYSRCRARQKFTQSGAQRATGVGDLIAILRSHGTSGKHPEYSLLTGAMAAPCMHAGGLAAGGQTTASWIAELRPGRIRHWVTGTAAPCTSLFKPVRVETPIAANDGATDVADASTLWWRHERLHRLALRNPAQTFPLFAKDRDRIERAWLLNPPEPEEAFAEHGKCLDRWLGILARTDIRDVRPVWVRRYWARRDRRAHLGAAVEPRLHQTQPTTHKGE